MSPNEDAYYLLPFSASFKKVLGGFLALCGTSTVICIHLRQGSWLLFPPEVASRFALSELPSYPRLGPCAKTKGNFCSQNHRIEQVGKDHQVQAIT